MLGLDPNKKFRLRVFYKKLNSLAYLSQLELARALEYSIRRSGLPFALSNGFSPHMKISFGRALSVGVESNCQIFDVFLTKYINDKQALDVIKENMPKNLLAYDAKYVDDNEKAASDAFSQNWYQATVDTKIEKIKLPKEITVVRKKKIKILDVEDFLIGDVSIKHIDRNNSMLDFCLQIKTSGSLKPDVFVKNVLESSGYSDAKVLKLLLYKAI